MMNVPEILPMFTALGGGVIGAGVQAYVKNRRIDKVDAIAALSASYNSMAERLEAQLVASEERSERQIKRLETEVDALRADIRRKDQRNDDLMERITTVAPIAPIAPIAPVAPVAVVAPILPIAPIEH